MTGGPAADCHCAQCGELGPLLPARLPGWTTPIRAPPNLDLLLGAACGQLSLCSMWTSTAERTCGQLVLCSMCTALADLRPTGTVLHVDRHCPMTGSLVHCCVHAFPGGILQLEHLPNLDQHCPAVRSGLHCAQRGPALPHDWELVPLPPAHVGYSN